LEAKAVGGALTGTQSGRDGSQPFTTAWSMATRSVVARQHFTDADDARIQGHRQRRRLNSLTPADVYFGRAETFLSNAKGSNARPSPIVACRINCMPHNLKPQMIQSLPSRGQQTASNL
jgi:hypothetical protein